MKLLVDSSSSLLLSLLLAQLPLFTSAAPAVHHRRLPHDLDKLTNQTKNLLRITNDLLKEHFSGLDLEHHRFKSLPVINNRANDLNSLELKPTLSQLHADLKTFEHHFEWLNRTSKKHHHPALPKLAEVITLIRSLNVLIQRQMERVEAQRLTPATPSLPPQLHSQFDVLQSTHELLQQFERFCNWAYRAFLSLKQNPR